MAEGFLKPIDRFGRPRVFVSHDTFREFDGDHTVPREIAREAFAWLS